MSADAEMKLEGDWKRAEALLRDLNRKMARASTEVLGKVGLYYEGEVKKGIISQAPAGTPFKPLAASTIKRKGSSKALIDNQDLRNSVTHAIVRQSGVAVDVFIGLLRTATHPSGQSTANLGRIHEYGDKKTGKRPPARPFIWPIAKSQTIRSRAYRMMRSEYRKHLSRWKAGGA